MPVFMVFRRRRPPNIHEQILALLSEALEVLGGLSRKAFIIMAGLQDVKDAIARVKTDVGNVTTKIEELQAQIAAGTGVTAEDLQGLVDDLNTVDTGLDAVAPDEEPAPE